MVVLWPNSNLRLKPNNNPARIMTWSRTTFFFFFVDFFCWKNLRVDTNCFSYKLGLGGFFCWKKNSVSRYIHLCIIRLCFAYYAKHKAAELMPSVYFFGKRTEIFFVTLFYEVLIKTDMRNDLVTSSMKVSVFLETHHSSIFLKMNTICLAIIFLTHKLFSNQIKISDKKKKKSESQNSRVVPRCSNFHVSKKQTKNLSDCQVKRGWGK